MKRITLLLILILVALSSITPALAQTTDDILADGSAEAVAVISSSALQVWTIIVVALVGLIGIVTFTALRMVYKSTPEWAHSGMIAVADKAIGALQGLADKTKDIELDDKVVDKIREVFDDFVNSIVELNDNSAGSGEDKQPIPPTDNVVQ